MFELTTGKLVLIVIVLILLFGSKKIPELAKGLGESVGLFKKALNGEVDKKGKK